MRDFTRYATKLTEECSRDKQRLLEVLEAAGIKLDNVASDTFGESGRLMPEALVAGERDPVLLAGLARGVLVNKSVQGTNLPTDRPNSSTDITSSVNTTASP
jgi:hypothetical protein